MTKDFQSCSNQKFELPVRGSNSAFERSRPRAGDYLFFAEIGCGDNERFSGPEVTLWPACVDSTPFYGTLNNALILEVVDAVYEDSNRLEILLLLDGRVVWFDLYPEHLSEPYEFYPDEPACVNPKPRPANAGMYLLRYQP